MSDLDHDHRKKQKLVDLIKEITPPAVATAATAASASAATATAATATAPPLVHGNHNVVITGGRVSIQLAAARFALRSSASHG